MTIEFWKMIFGFVLLGALICFGVIIVFGHVEERTSFGLMEIAGILGTLSGAFGNWAFSHKQEK